MAALPDDLQSALDTALRRYAPADLTRSVQQLMARYRSGNAPTEPIMASDLEAAAYAGYRMPATYAAVHAALTYAAEVADDFEPTSMVDIGGGTGSALWAASAIWPSLTKATVVEQVPRVLALGQRLASNAGQAVVKGAKWQRGVINTSEDAPDADLVTLSYVLGELNPDARDEAVQWLARSARMVVLIEPGTPVGYERIVQARDVLIASGLSIVAPCPHANECPVPRGKDWCHFAARLPRLGLHRLLKEATLNFEDEKFSYVAAMTTERSRPANRIVRHPQKRKGLVSLRLCTKDGQLADEIVTKRHGDRYRDARDVSWGDSWPLTGPE